MDTDATAVPAGGDTPIDAGLPADTGTDFEANAREKGWRPKDEWEGEVDEWIDAREFLKRQPLFDKIRSQSKKLKELEKTVHAMAQHYNITVEQAKHKAIQELRDQRKEAIELGEVAKVDFIDQRIEQVKQTAVAPPVANLAPEIRDFVETHGSWFNKDQEMTDFAVAFNESYLKRNPGDLEKSLDETLKAVKKAFPDKLENLRKQSPASVTTAVAGTQAAGGKYNLSKLSPEQKLAYNQFVKVHKTMSHEEYFKSLEEAGYLGE